MSDKKIITEIKPETTVRELCELLSFINNTNETYNYIRLYEDISGKIINLHTGNSTIGCFEDIKSFVESHISQVCISEKAFDDYIDNILSNEEMKTKLIKKLAKHIIDC